MLECRDLSFHYDRFEPGETPDFHFSFRLAPGECLSVEGPSGSGKSTLLGLLAGFLEPAGGTLAWQDQDLLALPPWERGITTVFQEHNLFDQLPVWLNVGLGLAPDMKLTREQQAQIRAGLAEVGLEGLHDRLPGELSGGQRQRVTVARALVNSPAIVWADEPTGALDSAAAAEIMSLLTELNQVQGLTIVLVTHDPGVGNMCNRIVRMHDGEIVGEDIPVRGAGPKHEERDTALSGSR